MFNESAMINHSHKLLDSKYYMDMSVAYVTLILSIFGIFGNLIAIFIFLSPSMRTITTNIYLTALSFSNIVYLFLHLLQYFLGNILIYKINLSIENQQNILNFIGCIPHSPILIITLFSNIYLTIALSIDRFIIVKYSLKAKKISTKRSALIVIFFICLTSLIYSIPYWLLQDYDFHTKQCRFNIISQMKFHKYYRLPILRIIPCLILTLINIQILRNLILRKQHKRCLGVETTRRRQADFNITLMFIINIAISILSSLLEISHVVWMTWFLKDSLTMILYDIIYASSKIMDIFDPLSECTLYFCFVHKFRKILKEYLRRLVNRNKGETIRTLIPRLPVKQTRRILLKYDLKISVSINGTKNQNLVVPPTIINETYPFMYKRHAIESKI